jgi:hypothetical protein
MNVNTRTPSVKMSKSETDRLREAGYILGHLKVMLSHLKLAEGREIQDIGSVEFQLEQLADKYGWKEKVTA